jgi:ribokinase
MLLVAGNLVYDWIAGPVVELAWDQTTWPPHFAAGIGGNGASTAFAAAREGASVRLVTACGNDGHGQACVDRLGGAGVDVVCLPGLTGATALTMGVFREDGARALIHRPGVLAEAFGEVPSLRAFAEGASWLHVANPFAIPGLRRRAVNYLREAKESGLTTSMDLGWDRMGEWMKVVGPCLPYCDWLFANAAEAAQVDLAGYSGHVVVKRGAAGCTVDGAPFPAVPVTAVDTTGAGDCFCGGFLAALLRGESAADAARAGNRCGAASVSHAGATGGLS